MALAAECSRATAVAVEWVPELAELVATVELVLRQAEALLARVAVVRLVAAGMPVEVAARLVNRVQSRILQRPKVASKRFSRHS